MAEAKPHTFVKICPGCGRMLELRARPRGALCQPCAASARNGRHRETNTRLYRIWRGMLSRVRGQNGKDRRFYIDKGIGVCADWRRFEAFQAWASSNGYAENLSIDRIDNAIGYEPGNCRWATAREQSWNSGKVKMITFRGETKPIRGWAETLGVKPGTLWARIRLSGMDVETAFTMPLHAKPRRRSAA